MALYLKCIQHKSIDENNETRGCVQRVNSLFTSYQIAMIKIIRYVSFVERIQNNCIFPPYVALNVKGNKGSSQVGLEE